MTNPLNIIFDEFGIWLQQQQQQQTTTTSVTTYSDVSYGCKMYTQGNHGYWLTRTESRTR